MVDQGQWVDPTLGHVLLGQEAKARGEVGPMAPHWAVSFKVVELPEHVETVQKMQDSGVRFTTGLDMGMAYGTHDRSAASAWAFVEMLGWANWKAVHAATAGTAEALGLDSKVGSLKAGMVADMAAFGGNPAENIRDLDRASTVVQSGNLVKLKDEVLV